MDSVEPLLLGGKPPGLHRVLLVAAAALALVVGQPGVGRPGDAVARIPHPEAEIHVVESHGKGFVQPAHFVVHAGPYQQAGPGNGGKILHRGGAEQVAAAPRRLILMAVARVAAQPRDDPRVLQSPIRVAQLRPADGGAAGVGALPQQLGEPIAAAHFHVVVQQQQVVAGGGFPPKVVEGGKIEALFRVGHHPQPRIAPLGLLIIREGGGVGGVVLNDEDLVVVPFRLRPDAAEAFFQIVGVVLVGDEDAHLGVALDGPFDPVGAGEQPLLHPAHPARAGQVVGQRLFGCGSHIGLRVRAAGGRALMDPPVVEHLRDVGRAAHLLDEAEEEVVVLAAVALRALAAHFVPQSLSENG